MWAAPWSRGFAASWRCLYADRGQSSRRRSSKKKKKNAGRASDPRRSSSSRSKPCRRWARRSPTSSSGSSSRDDPARRRCCLSRPWAEGMAAESARATKSFIILDVLPGRETVRSGRRANFTRSERPLRAKAGRPPHVFASKDVSPRAVAAACAQERAPGRQNGWPARRGCGSSRLQLRNTGPPRAQKYFTASNVSTRSTLSIL